MYTANFNAHTISNFPFKNQVIHRCLRNGTWVLISTLMFVINLTETLSLVVEK